MIFECRVSEKNVSKKEIRVKIVKFLAHCTRGRRLVDYRYADSDLKSLVGNPENYNTLKDISKYKLDGFISSREVN
jgi:hypothetical protein